MNLTKTSKKHLNRPDSEFENKWPIQKRVEELATEINSSKDLGEQLLAIYTQATTESNLYTDFVVKKMLEHYLKIDE
ncbi:hypothetical protein LOB39_02415 [Lactobacillus delbrueckii subsp. sunkii]|uniref:Uncharacterized protein n=1 Tax=Lactobacillus delbrueckii subsp. allosunkii TaxID=1050107 RepID=A0ABD4S9J0_9LACO|nr:hypothetical protein [Lactobacillus delbrueckii]MCD5517429.1 hypothetical protein [Lactobacillus delbrueckii subsp. sunkii]MCT3475626.1 hypothetical protein [Lactobacillus delbrueckii subsp. lactis]